MDFENGWLIGRGEPQGGRGIDVLLPLLRFYHEALQAAEEMLIELAEEQGGA